MADLSEYQTRKTKIDELLKQSGWDVKDRTKIYEEVDTKQSDFTSGKYKTMAQTLKNPEDSAYADYLLLDSNGLPLAVTASTAATQMSMLRRSKVNPNNSVL